MIFLTKILKNFWPFIIFISLISLGVLWVPNAESQSIKDKEVINSIKLSVENRENCQITFSSKKNMDILLTNLCIALEDTKNTFKDFKEALRIHSPCTYVKIKDTIRRMVEDKKVSKIIDLIQGEIGMRKKIELANIFFYHIIKIICILSGIIGLFWSLNRYS